MAHPAQLSSQNPWPGLRAFTENDREFFFGRERETSELLDLVKRSSVVVLYGQSGLGKTSLLQAGLLPDLKLVDFLPLRVRFDHSDDALPLAQQIKNAISSLLDKTKNSTARPGENETLWEYFHRRDVDFWGPRNRLLTPVIVLDQFEEVFTLGQRSEKSSARVARFAAELEAVLEHRAPEAVRKRLDANPDDAVHYDLDRQSVRFVISLREDFLPDLDPWRTRMPSLLANRFRLERMTGAQALDVVQSGGRDLLDSGAAREIVDFVSRSKREHSSRAMEQRDVEPALLSVVCDELNGRRINRGKSHITVDLLTDEREEIIQNFYDRAFDGADPRVRDWVEDKLLTGSGYRNRAALEDAIKAGLPQDAFDQLVDRRILHREERAGVVWLELTHDLLSDPASQSRTVREQRRLAEAGKQREAELSAQLAKSRKQVTVFGTLLVAIVALIAAGAFIAVRNQLMARERERLKAITSDMGTQLGSQNAEIGGNWMPTPTLLQIISTKKAFFQKGLPQGLSSQNLLNLNRNHVNLLNESSEALYDTGRFDDGLKDAQAALAILNQEGWPASSREELRLMRAEALHNQANGYLATGQLSKASASYNDALNLLPHDSAKELDPAFAHIYVLSQFGLGEVELHSLAPASAMPHFQAALDFANARKPETDDVRWWKALAYQGLALSQWDYREAEKWYSKANDEVQLLMNGDSGNNPRWKRLFANIAYFRSMNALFLNDHDGAMSLLEASQAAAEKLVARDPENRDWQLMLLQAKRGLGKAHSDFGELNQAESVLEDAEKSAKALNEGQPTWVRAAYVRSLIVQTLASIQKARFTQASKPKPGKTSNAYFDSASRLFDQAHDILQRSAKAAPEDLELFDQSAWTLKYQGDLCRDEASATRTAAGKDQQLLAKADKQDQEARAFYNQALDQLQPLAGITKSSSAVTAHKAWTESALGDVFFSDLKQPQAAISPYITSAEAFKKIAELQRSPEHFDDLSAIYNKLGDAYLEEKDFQKAASEYALANVETAKSLKIQPQDINFRGKSAYIHYRFADIALKQHDPQGALDELDKAISINWDALQDDFANTWLNNNLDGFRRLLEDIHKAIESNDPENLADGHGDQPEKTDSLSEPVKSQLLQRIAVMRDKSDPTLILSHYGQSSAALRPLLPGAWRMLTGSEFSKARDQLLASAKNVKSGQIQRIRKLPLDFYEDADLYEAVVKTSDGRDGIIDYVLRGGQRFLLDGSVGPLNEMNKTSPPKLDTPARATAYLRFRLGAIQLADDGRVEIVEGVNDLDWLLSTSASQRDSIAKKATPLVLQAGSWGSWNAVGSVELAGELDRASFNISRDGTFSIPRTELLESNLPISVDAFYDGIRVQETMEGLWQESVKRNPDDEAALKQLKSLYHNAGRWKEAVEADKNWIAYLQRQSKDNNEKAKDLASAYFPLAVAQAYSGDFAGALATVDTWKKIAPNDLQAERVRAHALLFLGRTQEAEAVYVRNVGKSIGTSSWQNLIAADFKELEGKNLKNQDFEHILDLLMLERLRQVKEQLKLNPNNADALQVLPQIYFEMKHWQDAVDAEKNRLDIVQRDSKNDIERTKLLTGAYLSLSWYQLFARDFTGALASTDAGKKLDPSYLLLDTNRAHALLFLGRTEEAETIYLGNRGKKFDPKGDQTWEEAILDDFNSLEKDGLTHPEIPRIRKLLSSQSK